MARPVFPIQTPSPISHLVPLRIFIRHSALMTPSSKCHPPLVPEGFFLPLQTVPPIVLTPRSPEESLPLNSHLFSGRSKNSFLPVLAPQPLPPGSPHLECSALDLHVAPPFLHSGLSPNATSLERSPLLCVTTPPLPCHPGLLSSRALVHLFCLLSVSSTIENPWRAGAGSCPFQ